MERMRPPAISAPTGTAYAMRSKWKSAAWSAVPVVLSGPSMRGVGVPMIDAGVVLMFVPQCKSGGDLRLQQIFNAHGQVAHAHAGGVIHGPGDGRSHSGHADFADAARAVFVHD